MNLSRLRKIGIISVETAIALIIITIVLKIISYHGFNTICLIISFISSFLVITSFCCLIFFKKIVNRMIKEIYNMESRIEPDLFEEILEYFFRLLAGDENFDDLEDDRGE